MPRKRPFRRMIVLLAPVALLLFAAEASALTIVRGAIGTGVSGHGQNPNLAWTIHSTVGETATGIMPQQISGWVVQSGFWIPWESSGPIVIGLDEPQPFRLMDRLEQNVPNPFNPSTTISFSLSERRSVELVVMDVRGRVVDVLMRESRDAGTHQFEYRPADLPSGVYFYRLRAGDFVQTRRFVLLK